MQRGRAAAVSGHLLHRLGGAARQWHRLLLLHLLFRGSCLTNVPVPLRIRIPGNEKSRKGEGCKISGFHTMDMRHVALRGEGRERVRRSGGGGCRVPTAWRFHTVKAVEGEEARHRAWGPSSAVDVGTSRDKSGVDNFHIRSDPNPNYANMEKSF
jgi:hypothetical protein